MTSVTSRAPFDLEHSFPDELPGLFEPWAAAPVAAPRLLVLNRALAEELGLEANWLASTEGVGLLCGNTLPASARPVAMAYAGHQFGGYSPRLGDGRALLVGELVDRAGCRRDLHLKGSGPTPFARGGDGRAAVGPMLRELIIGEAMAALGIPTTRALAVVATGELIARETMLPGAVLARVAASHLRVGTFEYAARLADRAVLRRLADYAIARHYPDCAAAEQPYLAFFAAVTEAQAALVASWMSVGFVHGVMNTDNMTISGETIDYGPCAFMDRYDPATVFSSIDHGGRYAYGNQPTIAQWNLARLGETLLPLINEDTDAAIGAATDVLQSFPERFRAHWRALLSAKLGLTGDAQPGDEADRALGETFLALLDAERVDMTSAFRALSDAADGDDGPLRGLWAAPHSGIGAWLVQWRTRLGTLSPDSDRGARSGSDGRARGAVAARLDAVNPVHVPRNHLMEEALAAASEGDLEPTMALLEIVRRPFEARPGEERYAAPAPPELGPYRTFCGT